MARGEIRPVSPDDIPAITRIVRDCGFPERSEAGWHWVLFENPDQDGIPSGWVCERDGTIVAFVGNFASRYRIGERMLRAAIGHTLVTDLSAGRQAGITLARHGLRQSGVDVYSTLNNNGVSARILPRIGAAPWLGEAGRVWLEWPTAPLRIAATQLQKRLHRPAPDRERFDRAFDLGLDVADRPAPRVTVEPLDRLDDVDLARLSGRLAETGQAVRLFDRERLDYRRRDPDRAGGLDYLLARIGGVPALLAGTLLTKPSADGLEHVEIVDWLGVDDEDGIAAQIAVLRHILSRARRARVAKVRMHFPRAVPEAVTQAGGWCLTRELDYDPCHVQFRDNAMRQAWTPRPGDTDYFFASRTPPRLMR